MTVAAQLALSINQAVDGLTGASFYRQLLQQLQEQLQVEFVILSDVAPNMKKATVRFMLAGGEIQSGPEYEVAGTPCEDALYGRRACSIRSDLQARYPADSILADWGVDGFAGVALRDSLGQPVGLLEVFSVDALSDPERAATVLELLAGRVEGELQRDRSLASLEEKEQRYRLLFEVSAEGLCVIDQVSLEIIDANRSALRLLGHRSLDTLVGHSVMTLLSGYDDTAREQEAVVFERSVRAEISPFNAQLAGSAGHPFEAEINVTPFAFGGVEQLLVQLRDVSLARDAMRRVEESQRRFEFLALHDPLTSLPNRIALRSRLQRVDQEAQPAPSLALLFMDLDNFREVNDALGHGVGDELLQQFARRLMAAFGEDTELYRLGGDEFAMLLSGCSRDYACSQADAVREALKRPFNVGGMRISLDCGIGIALYPDHARSREELMRRADIALHHAKQERREVLVFHGDDDRIRIERLQLTGELLPALECGEIRPWLQPIVDLTDGSIQSFEALARWHHPHMGILSPARFIPLVEVSNSMGMLTSAILHQALQVARQWEQSGHVPKVAVNVSAKTVLDPSFVGQLSGACEKYGTSPENLELEITESVLLEDPLRAMAILHQLESLGVSLSIDDFGTGYSSLAYLKHLPVRYLKVDRTFIRDMAEDDQDRSIVKAVIDLAANLGLKVIAEGVEDATTAALLRELGCDLGQGFFFSKPVPAELSGDLLKSGRLWEPGPRTLENAVANPRPA